MGGSSILMAMYMKANERMTKHLVKVSTSTLKGQNMRGVGIMISNLEMAERFGLMEPSITANTMRVSNMAMEGLNGQMDPATKATLSQIESKEKEYIHGQIIECIKGYGRTTKWTEPECSTGLMEENMSGSIGLTKSMALESFIGVKDKSLLVHGSRGGW